MLFDKKIIELKSLIYKTLSPYLSSKCAFLELPYYPNVGDLLILGGYMKNLLRIMVWSVCISFALVV